MVFVAIARVTVSPRTRNRSPPRHSCRLCLNPDSHQCIRTPFPFNTIHLEIRNATATAINVLIDTTFVRVASGQQRRRNRLFTHTPTHDGEYVHCITNSGANQHHSVHGSIQRKLVKAMKLQGSGCRTTFNFASRENRRLIRMRSMSSSLSVTPLELLRLLHLRTVKFSLAQQCVSNVVLFASSHDGRHAGCQPR